MIKEMIDYQLLLIKATLMMSLLEPIIKNKQIQNKDFINYLR